MRLLFFGTVIERCGDVHKLVVLRICTRFIAIVIALLDASFFNLGIRHLCLSNLTTDGVLEMPALCMSTCLKFTHLHH